MYLVGFMRSDLSEDFFVIPAHRDRFVANRWVYERKGWIVRSVEATNDVEKVYCAVGRGTEAFSLVGNILTPTCR